MYTKVSKATKQILYQYIKDENISLLNYHFRHFFKHCIQINKIQVISHHFSSHKIEGLTMIDKFGITFSYERNNPIVKQNFTLCHELGHFILDHKGSYFTESVDYRENELEREANIFSAIVLMPDIVLLSKIYYSCDTFQKVQYSLGISKQSLYFRLLDLLREHITTKEYELRSSIEQYINGQNAPLLLLMGEIKEKIIEEFNQYKPCLNKKIAKCISRSGFATSEDIPELLNQKNWNNIKEANVNIKIWLVYNKGKTIAYVWDKYKMSDKDAKKKAELQLLLM